MVLSINYVFAYHTSMSISFCGLTKQIDVQGILIKSTVSFSSTRKPEKDRKSATHSVRKGGTTIKVWHDSHCLRGLNKILAHLKQIHIAYETLTQFW